MDTQKRAVNFQPGLPKYIHFGGVPKLFVRMVSGLIVSKEWTPTKNIPVDIGEYYFVVCSRTGSINWKDTKVYTPAELVARDNVYKVQIN